jgi:hypothetical protein
MDDYYTAQWVLPPIEIASPIVNESPVPPPTSENIPQNHERTDSGAVLDPDCKTQALKKKLCDLASKLRKPGWNRTLEAQLVAILKENEVREIFTCLCPVCQQAKRVYALATTGSFDGAPRVALPYTNLISQDQLTRSRKLLSICIIKDRAWLGRKLLLAEFDDTKFSSIESRDILVEQAEISPGDALMLFDIKDWFFGVKMARYLRCSSRKQNQEVPHEVERNWLQDEMLELTRVLALPIDDPARYIPAYSSLEDLVFREYTGIIDRPNSPTSLPWDDQLTVQSLGWLVFDFIWFLHGGSPSVAWLDGLRKERSITWITEIPLMEIAKLERTPSLSKAFQIAWFLIQPIGDFALSSHTTAPENFAYIHKQFAENIWPVMGIETPTRGNERQYRGSKFGNTTNRKLDNSKVEIGRDNLRWL